MPLAARSGRCTRRLVLAAGAASLLAPAGASQFREITWLELVPPGWDPMKDLRAQHPDLAQLRDDDPRAKELMDKLRAVVDQAPTVAGMAGQSVRLPGYLVPLDDGRQGLREFLLVPYFGACIHTPPPPSNQVVLGRAARPIAGFHSMDAVWAYGRLEIEHVPSSMGVAGYTMRVDKLERYGPPG